MPKPITVTPEKPERLPPVHQTLIDWLERTYPDRMPDALNLSEKEIAYNAGQVSVVRKLRSIHEELHQRALENR